MKITQKMIDGVPKIINIVIESEAEKFRLVKLREKYWYTHAKWFTYSELLSDFLNRQLSEIYYTPGEIK